MPETTHATSTVLPLLPALSVQAERLIELGVHEIAGLSTAELRAFAEATEAPAGGDGALLAVHPGQAPASALARLLRRDGKPGFVVTDMPDVDLFAPLDTVALPDAPLYLLTGLDRGDRMANWSPHEALPALTAENRTPLLLTEGIHWVMQQPAVLERNHCFMTIGSRLRKANGALDARTPAIWISNGTGRDGRERRNAPKVGWCWAGNRHTWLGFASATGRRVQDL
ncbi:hypothetical protein BX264_7132 [Streptomyces sp. 2333.5]|uniref:DUF5701 family protein n=1 Tax=unclassified Streptomyces TaxID=2593676 RepID=UPI00089A49C3|nr:MULTISPECIES: DUF5701 family protein [unclassified Streptomyces]PJI99765.1 hypothetical protein BX264_0014 [Streptomyces sp. 2333.5]PJJ06591.1 hypothetical protein BX264_7132 [Streptomyces sp. 2333.5]SEB58555.1 hypothetical protein SAMN05428943_0014 [Streptomyces sp. 2314.4]SEC39270.1 hypothetical protein SAMN05428942_0014 [Streptomyces sp. 2112.2]SEF11411.1 hypothetical protein SAMN05428942_7233 [Streptomyces sp. 2112.2]